MAGFDAQRHLRLTGPRRNPEFAAAAATLIAVDAITVANAQALIDDHDRLNIPVIDDAQAVLAVLRLGGRTGKRIPGIWPSRGGRCWPAGGKRAGRSAPSRSARSRRPSTG